MRGGEYVQKAKIGRAVMDADVFISLTHFKGHEEAGFGGALKNIGMGCGSRAGKMEQHNAGKIAEYAQAVVDGRPCFHISLVIDVSPNCDCHPENDAAIIPNVGMFASFDPVALDMACVDAVNAQPPLPGAAAAGDCGHDHFHHLHPETDWMSCLEHAEKLGMGTREYELIKI